MKTHKARSGSLGSRLSRKGLPDPTPSVTRLVWVMAGGRCSFVDCRAELVEVDSDGTRTTVLGEVAHIVARSKDGARGSFPPPGDAVNSSTNLMLLCPTHHELIDQRADTYTVERLVGIKSEHERWVREQLSQHESGAAEQPLYRETLHSSLLCVERVPERVYLTPCNLTEDQVKSLIRYPADRQVALPFAVKGGNLLTFMPTTGDDHPFVDAVSKQGSMTAVDASSWWEDPDKSGWYMTLLNRTLHKLTGRRGLRFDKDHKRYYFEPRVDEQGRAVEVEVEYQPLNQSKASRHVVWQPRRKTKGQDGEVTVEKRPYWIHLAANLRFLRVNRAEWVLAIRPEHRLTKDGFELLPSMAVGPRATRLKSHLYNYDLLGELQFWKEYLSDAQPRIIVDLGGQRLVIDARLMHTDVEWVGVADDDLAFDNTAREDDLFTSAEYDQAMHDGQQHADAELENWEVSDLTSMVEEDEHDDEDT